MDRLFHSTRRMVFQNRLESRRSCSVTTPDLLATVASWEDRFLLGTKRVVGANRLSQAVVLYYDEYADATHTSRSAVESLCSQQNITCNSIRIAFSGPANSWRAIYNCITTTRRDGQNVIVDFSTMPRETLWVILSVLR